MNKLRKIVSGFLLAVMLAGPVTVTSSAIPSPKSSPSSKSRTANRQPETLHVKAYIKKNGERVKARNRAEPQPK